MLRKAADWIPLHRELLNITYDDWINEQKEWRPYYEFALDRFMIFSYHQADKEELERRQKEHDKNDGKKP